MKTFEIYFLGPHGLINEGTINALNIEDAAQQYYARPYTRQFKEYTRIIDPEMLTRDLASRDGRRLYSAMKLELERWHGWQTFFEQGGCPGCLVVETADITCAAEWLTRDAIIRDGLIMATAAGIVNELRDCDNSYSPDF